MLAEMSANMEGIVATVISILSTLVTLFVIPWLNAKRKEANAKALQADVDARGRLFARLKAFVYRRAESLAQNKLPEIAGLVKAGKLKTVTDVKVELQKLGGVLSDEARRYFLNQNVDLVKEVGDEALDNLIRSAADRVAPFPGKETAVMLLQEQVSDRLIESGVEWVRNSLTQNALSPALVSSKGGECSERP